MKIWYQTGRGYRYNREDEVYGRALEQQCAAAARPGTEIHVEGTRVKAEGRDQYKIIQYYHCSQVFNNMLRAEAEGYDAFIIGCSYDEKMEEGRELVDMPVVGLGQSNLLLASMYGNKFAVVTRKPYMAEKYDQLADRYGLNAHYLRGPYVAQIADETDYAAIAEAFLETCKTAVAEGASVLIPVPADNYQMMQKAGYGNSVDGATVLDPVAVAVKFAEMMVDLKSLGIQTSQKLNTGAFLGYEKRRQVLETYMPAVHIEMPEALKGDKE